MITSRRASSFRARLLPLSIAGLVCFVIASIAGYSLWYFTAYNPLASSRSSDQQQQQSIVNTSAPKSTEASATTAASVPQAAPAPETTPTPPTILAPAGEVALPGGEVVLGGDTDMPLRRIVVEPFTIAETETTNEQYAEFVRETKHQPPDTWTNGEVPPADAAKPVTGVTWQDAVDYCAWLSKKIGAREVRLPTEGEWEWAARGREGLRYPWGNEWDDAAAASAETNGEVQFVKSHPQGRSPFGVYDMAGSVWEWLADPVRTDSGTPRMVNNIKLMVAKGGAANEPKAVISASSRQQVPATTRFATLGFRYVVVRGGASEEAAWKKNLQNSSQASSSQETIRTDSVTKP